jgi:hypothetical protein
MRGIPLPLPEKSQSNLDDLEKQIKDGQRRGLTELNPIFAHLLVERFRIVAQFANHKQSELSLAA